MSDGFDRLTYIRPDGSAEKTVVVEGRAFRKNGDECLAIKEKIAIKDAPTWTGAGMDVVAARDDGTVVRAFTVGDMTRMATLPTQTHELPVGTIRIYQKQ